MELFLLKFIHHSRETLQDEVNKQRTESLMPFGKHEKSDKVCFEIQQLEAQINDILEQSTDFDENAVAQIRTNSDKIALKIAEIKKLSWYFSENTTSLCNSMLGYMINKKIDRNYFKIRNLKSLLTSETDSTRVNLASVFQLTILRQEVLALSKNRIVKIYFTTNRSLHFELFDGVTGECLKSLNAFENLSSFPISYGYGHHFCVCFTSKNTERQYYDMNTNFIRLYDLDFNLINSQQRFTSIESIYMNESFVLLYYSHKQEACCEVYDYQMNLLHSFGQQLNVNGPFYMEKSTLTVRQQMTLNFKLNPKIFGYTEEHIYFSNFSKMCIMSRKTGLIEKCMSLRGDRPYFLLDSQQNIIQVNPQAKKIALYNQDFEFLISNTYGDALDVVQINKENQLAFVDMEKKTLIFI